MPATERTRDRADARARAALGELGRELRDARRGAGLSQRSVALAAGISQAEVSLLEAGRRPAVSLSVLTRALAVVGLELSIRAYPGGRILRDEGHVRLLQRFRAIVGDGWSVRLEVPLPGPGGRAWDAILQRPGIRIAIEAETRPRDLQAMLRRLSLKRRDDEVTAVVLLLADSRWNRMLVRGNEAELRSSFPVAARPALTALRAGESPGDAIVIV